MTLRRKLMMIVALIVLFATAIEYGLIVTSTSESVATGGIIISEN